MEEKLKELQERKEEAIQQIDLAWKEIDVNNEGFVQTGDFEKYVRDIYFEFVHQPYPTNKQIKNVVNLTDENKDGKISKEEFTTLMLDVLEYMVKVMYNDDIYFPKHSKFNP